MPSSVIAHIIYNAANEILRIIFKSGAVYDYKNVPSSVYTELLAAKSKGTYLNNKIKGVFSFKKVK